MQSKKRALTGLYLGNMGANVFGFLTIVVLNVFTPLEFIQTQRFAIFGQGKWITFFLFVPLVLLLVLLLQYRIQRPIAKMAESLDKKLPIPSRKREKARRRLLNLPFYILFTNFLIYFTIPLFVLLNLYFLQGIPLIYCLFLYSRAFFVGLIASGLSFLLIEYHSRRALIPSFFPEGRLANISNTMKISIWIKIRALTLMGTVYPMLIFSITLLFVFLENREHPVTEMNLVKDIFYYGLLLFSIFIVVSLFINVLVIRSILTPIKEMLFRVNEIRKGDYNRRIQVISNDELGILGDAGNDMIQGLAEREKIRETFGKYVTPEIRDQILADKIPLNGEIKTATLLFSDIRNFTRYVEENDPEEVIKSMKAYFTAMQNAIRRNKGLVLQYVGDEIEAVFGVPLEDSQQVDHAVQAALDMRKNLEELNSERARDGKPAFRHGIGIFTGPVLAGNTGSQDRLSYALIGNTVNLASRIQELTKTFKCDILVSEETVKSLQKNYPIKKETPQKVKGYSKPVLVFSLL